MKLKTRKDLAWRRIAGEIFIVDAAGSRMHELNGAAALVWEGLAAGRHEAAIAAALAEEYEVAAPDAAADTAEFIGQLFNSGLIVDAEK
ncbi:MAG: hypothetical protein A2X29_06820 [Elusimicrobia bacterium GWA2_64_40]|nr:MAG: hypothetical protein A2X29_06820 [Elusimicrobia bacterium GWA2_64_40]OGR66115.1 MAG: hypothetical protein A2X30_09765 [Elusimicrobia bacterium GWB2_63_16]